MNRTTTTKHTTTKHTTTRRSISERSVSKRSISKRSARSLVAIALGAATLTACTKDQTTDTTVAPTVAATTAAKTVAAPPAAGKDVTLVAYDSFSLPKETLAAFQAETGMAVKVLTNGDTGELLNKAILTKDRPLGDVLWAVDNTLLDRAKRADIFDAHTSASEADLDPALTELVKGVPLTPVDYGDVCINYDKAGLTKAGVAAPTSFEDLTKPEYKNQLVVENPATSSPGLAFMLGTIAHFGPTRWENYWEQLHNNGVKVVSGWTEAYEGSFTAGGGSGDRTLVVSYASSPPAAVMFGSDPNATEAPTGVVDATCFRVSEFVGVLKGGPNPEGAAKLVDFLTRQDVQEQLPLNMFVFPANTRAVLPKLFVDFAAKPASPLTLTPEDISANREHWIDAWTRVVQ